MFRFNRLGLLLQKHVVHFLPILVYSTFLKHATAMQRIRHVATGVSLLCGPMCLIDAAVGLCWSDLYFATLTLSRLNFFLQKTAKYAIGLGKMVQHNETYSNIP